MYVLKQQTKEMFTLEEIKSYCGIIGISDVDQLFHNQNKLEVLTAILRAHCQVQPFQNLTVVSEPYGKRHRPTWNEVKSSMLKKEGGLCYSHHYLFYEMLKTLKYNITVVPVNFAGTLCHLNILTRDLVRPGDLYLLEAGCGYPTFHPICLDFEKESPVYKESYSEYKFIKQDGLIKRLHREGDKGEEIIKYSKSSIDGWRVLTTFSTEDEVPDIESLDDLFDTIFTDRAVLVSLHDCIKWVCFPNFQARVLSNSRVMEESSEHNLVSKQLKNNEEIIEAINDLCPPLAGYIEKALENCPAFTKKQEDV